MAEIYGADKNFNPQFFKNASCAFGVFDGVHCGHRFLLACAQASAQESGGKSIALTFDIDPDEIFHPKRLKKLMTNEERIEALAESGVDAVVILPFTEEFYSSSPQEFLIHTFNGYPPASLHVGFDFRFGFKASGTVDDLVVWSQKGGTHIEAHDLESADGEPISATRIRLLLTATNIEEANRLLGRPYSLSAIVKPGRGDGQDFGFRTANLHIPPQLQALGDGVYAAYGWIEGKRYKAAVSVGVSPVFSGETEATCEVHLIDFEGDLYGRSIKVEFMHFLRPMIKFASTEELITTVKGNIDWAKENL